MPQDQIQCSTSSTKSDAKSVAEAINRLFSAYRRDDYADAVGFVRQLGTVLEQYPPEIVAYITSPLTGIQRRLKWPPSIAEVVEACDEHRAHLAKLARYAAMPKARPVKPSEPDARAQVLTHYGIRGIPPGWDAVDLAKMAAKHGANLPNVVDEILKDHRL